MEGTEVLKQRKATATSIKKEKTDLENNIEALKRDAVECKVRDSLNALQKAALVLHVDEFEKMYYEQNKARERC